MPTISIPCPDCGTDCEWQVSQAIGLRTLVWSRSMTCRACGSAIEEDGEGLLPMWMQKVLIEENGLWAAELVSESDRPRSVAVLRSLLSLDLKAAAQILKAQKAALWLGTQLECLWIKQHLESAGILVEVARA